MAKEVEGVAGERLPGATSGLRQRLSGGGGFGAGCRQFGVDGLCSLGQRGQPLGPLRRLEAVGDDLVHGGPVLALQVGEYRGAFFHGPECPRVVFDALGDDAQLPDGIVDLGDDCLEPGHERIQRRIEVARRADPVEGEAQAVERPLLVVDDRGGGGDGIDDLRGVADPNESGLQVDVLAGMQPGGGYLARLVPGELQLPGQRPEIAAEGVAIGLQGHQAPPGLLVACRRLVT